MTTQTAHFHGSLLLAEVIEPDEIGRRIKEARGRKQWSQLKLAMEADVSPTTVSRWERGMLPPVRELIRLAGVLGVEPEYLVEAEPSADDARARVERRLEALEAGQADTRSMLAELLRIARGDPEEPQAGQG